jgi:hypothetical protein
MSFTIKSIVCSLALALAISSTTAHAAFTSYVIRESGGAPGILPNNDYVPGATEFVIAQGGQKAALGSNDINGSTIGDITGLAITRHDDTTRFTSGSGPAVAPYFNIWVTDGLGNYAVIANEPSNPSFFPLFVQNGNGSKTYNLSYADIANEPAKVYETLGTPNNTWVNTLVGINGPLTFADVANLEIAAPPESYITAGGNGIGTGAPRELGTDIAYGVNWVFGETLSNYISGSEGYVVSRAIAAVPEPASLALCGFSAMGLTLFRPRRK